MKKTNRKPYWCPVCKKQHRRTSMIGHEHERFEGLFRKVRSFPITYEGLKALHAEQLENERIARGDEIEGDDGYIHGSVA